MPSVLALSATGGAGLPLASSAWAITIPYVRLLSDADQAGAPVIYLEGGPGGAGTEALEDESLTSLFKDVLASRDIILVDQRGTGDAKPELACSHSHMFPMAPSPTPAERLEVIERLSMSCADQVRAHGIDLSAYNSQESADDIADLARHLNVEKIVLLGASYGSHLALSVIRRHETLIERALLALIEGPDDTFKRPRQLDDMLLALDAEAADPASNWPHSEPPSVAVEQVLRQFNEPKMASWVDAYGRKTEVEIARHDLEVVLFGQMGRDIFWRSLPGVVERLRTGDWSQLARTTINWREERVSDPRKERVVKLTLQELLCSLSRYEGIKVRATGNSHGEKDADSNDFDSQIEDASADRS